MRLEGIGKEQKGKVVRLLDSCISRSSSCCCLKGREPPLALTQNDGYNTCYGHFSLHYSALLPAMRHLCFKTTGKVLYYKNVGLVLQGGGCSTRPLQGKVLYYKNVGLVLQGGVQHPTSAVRALRGFLSCKLSSPFRPQTLFGFIICT